MGAKELDVVITVIAVILVIMLWIMLYDSNRFVVRHYSLRDQRIKKSVKAVVLADLHNKRYGKENERLLQAIDEIGPDMILIAGDMLTAKPKATLDVAVGFLTELAKKYPLTYHTDKLTGPYIMEKIYEVTKGDAIITTEVGQHQMWAAQFYKYKEPRQLLTSGGLGTMGYGLGASIGAKWGRRDKTVINIAGDGCFRMNMNEIATATRYNIPVIEVVVNNHVLGMVRQWQTLFYGQRYSATVLDDQVDFVKLAEAMGAKAYKVTTCEEFEAAIKDAIALNIPCLLDCHIEKDDKVFPMVAPGAAISEAFGEEKFLDC